MTMISYPIISFSIILLALSSLVKVEEIQWNEVTKESKIFLDIITSVPMMVIYTIPITGAILTFLHILPSRLRLSYIYNTDGEVIKSNMIANSKLPPFLPNPKFVSKETYEKIYNSLKKRNESNTNKVDDKASWVLLTGCTRGIGRGIAISLARRRVPIVLVSKNEPALVEFSKVIQECYGVPVHIIISDLSKADAVEKIVKELKEKDIAIEFLINNAGVADTREMVEMEMSKIEEICNINMLNMTKLTKILGASMKEKQRGRIVFLSSLVGAVPIPMSSEYAASKAYTRSLARSLGRELEKYNIACTCVMPGAVAETDFASSSNMKSSLVWKFPIGRLSPQIVAECAVINAIKGNQEVVVGWLNAALLYIVQCLLPPRLIMIIGELSWKPVPSLNIFRKKKTSTNTTE